MIEKDMSLGDFITIIENFPDDLLILIVHK